MFWDDEHKPTIPLKSVDTMSRDGSAPLPEIWAEAMLAKRFGWNLPVFRGEQAADTYGGSGAYRLTGPSTLLQQRTPTLDILRVMGFSKFGNFVRQLRNAFAVAHAFGTRRIEFPAPHPFFGGRRIGKVDLVWQITRTASGRPNETGLAGRFYYLDALGLRPTIDEQAQIIMRYIRPMMTQNLRLPHPDVREDDLVLHFRGDDIFGVTGTYIHREYGQPPLSFYLAAVERERPGRVWLVAQDRGNPCIDAAEAALRSKGIEVLSHSGTLENDLRVLLTASRLVAGIGSFCPAVTALSAHPKRLYLFGSTVPTLQRLGTHIVEGRDERGEYQRAVRMANWTASAEQRALMLSYPAEALRFVEHPATSRPGAG